MFLPKRSFYFMRHGETDWNKTGRIMGSMDIALNDVGRAQALAAGNALKDKGIDSICHSPKARALETARIVADVIGAGLIEVNGLEEVCLGVLEGGPKVMGLWNGYMAGNTPAGAETYESFRERTVNAVAASLDQGHKVLVVAHGGSYVALKDFTGFLGTPKANNCDIFHFKAGDKWDIEAVSAVEGSRR